MFSQYFGNFLLNEHYITSDQLATALDQIHQAHVKVGVLAIDYGYMTPRQVTEIHNLQYQVDKRFGELAIEAGYMSDVQLTRLLAAQKEAHLQLGQLLIDQGLMTIEQYGAALEKYKQRHHLSENGLEMLQNGVSTEVVKNIAGEHHQHIEYLDLFIKNTIRFIDSNVSIEKVHYVDDYDASYLIEQNITGKTPLYSYFSGNESALLALAENYAGEKITSFNELALSAVNEFLNTHNGIYLVNMSNNGIECELAPLAIHHQPEIHHFSHAEFYKISVGQVTFELILATEPLVMPVHTS